MFLVAVIVMFIALLGFDYGSNLSVLKRLGISIFTADGLNKEQQSVFVKLKNKL